MNQFPTDQIPQLVAWGLGLLEFILALYVLLLNAWHIANRHVSALFLLFAVNSFSQGLAVAATNLAQATWPTYILAATTPAMQLMALLAAVALLQPGWMQRRWRWLWGLAYLLVILPALLVVADASMGTQLWYTGLDAETYTGGYPNLTLYVNGSLAPLITTLYLRIASAAFLIPTLYTAILDRKASRQARRLAWLLMAGQSAILFLHMALRDVIPTLTRTLSSGALLITIYAYATFRQMISEQHAQRGRLSIRLTLIVMAIAVPLIMAGVILVSTQAGREMKEDALDRLQDTNRALAANVSVWLELNLDALQHLVTLPDIVSMDGARQKPILETMAATHPHMYLVSTTDLNGLNVARSDDVPLKDYSDRPWFLGARAGAPVTFQSLIGRTSGEPALVASMPIRNPSGEIVGVGMFASDLTDIAQEVLASRVGETGVAYVIDTDNRVIAHPDPAFSAELRDLSSYPPVVALREGTRGLVSFTDEDGTRWQAYVDELDYGWGVIVQQEESELIAPLRRFQAMAWGGAITAAILLGILASLAVHQALMPIGELTDAVTAIASGDMTRVVEVESQDEIGTLARAFNLMTEQLRNLIGGLEQRVAERTRDLERRARYLEISAQVARDATTLLEPQQLLERVVTLISERFGFYHAGIFLLDESREWAVLQAASGEGGRRMLARGHRLRVGVEGIVGYVTGHGEPRIALDVGEDAVFFNNPDLPDTRSEMALPLRARGEIIGALDVQSREPEAFTEEDVAVMQILADQVAMAISNARLFRRVQDALEAERRAYGETSRQAWQTLLQAHRELGYRYEQGNVIPLKERIEPQAEDGLPELTLPVTVRGNVIGTINARKPANVGDWTPDEIRLLEILADQLGMALESARLYQDTQRRAIRERLVSEIADRMQASMDPDTILRTTVQELGRALGARLAVVEVTGPEEGDGKVPGEKAARGEEG